MGLIITLIRMPLGFFAIMIIAGWFFTLFMLESMFAIVAFILISIFDKRNGIQNSWLADYPTSKPILNTCKNSKGILAWVFKD
jgi:hypothetical protein